jgi:hypothetical protein
VEKPGCGQQGKTIFGGFGGGDRACPVAKRPPAVRPDWSNNFFELVQQISACGKS